MIGAYAHSPGRRLTWLARRLANLDRLYLITGPQAAYEYHRWLAPLENLATLQVYAEDVPAWYQMDGEGCRLFETPPTTAEVHAVQEAIILDPTLEPERYQRHRVIGGLTFIAPEDLCLDLVERARGETSLAEAAAILIAQRDALAWDVLLDQAERRGLARRLGVLLEAINAETEMDLVPLDAIEELYRRVGTRQSLPEEAIYPPGRRQSVPPLYQPIAGRWGIHLALPRYVIGKVVFDLHLQPQRS
jgi:hypothetical protein